MKSLIALVAALLFAVAPAVALGVACDHAASTMATEDADPHAGHGDHGAPSDYAGVMIVSSGDCPDDCAGGPGCSGCFATGAVVFAPADNVDRLPMTSLRVAQPAAAPDGRLPLVDPPPPRV